MCCSSLTCNPVLLLWDFAVWGRLFARSFLPICFMTPSVAFCCAAISNMQNLNQRLIYSWEEAECFVGGG